MLPNRSIGNRVIAGVDEAHNTYPSKEPPRMQESRPNHGRLHPKHTQDRLEEDKGVRLVRYGKGMH